MINRTIATAVLSLCTAYCAAAQGFFLPVGDVRLRNDLTLLVDEGVINLPLNEWPLARHDVAQAIEHVDASNMQDAALRYALSRIRAATTVAEDAGTWRIRELSLTGGQPGLLRDESTLGRENGELTSSGGVTTGRYNLTLSATGVLDASDGKDIRFDG